MKPSFNRRSWTIPGETWTGLFEVVSTMTTAVDRYPDVTHNDLVLKGEWKNNSSQIGVCLQWKKRAYDHASLTIRLVITNNFLKQMI